MNLLLLQETDWIKRGPHQQHHLMDRMALRGHEVHVIDYDYLWKDDKEKINIPFVYYLIDHLHTLLPGEFKRSIARQFEKATLKGADKIPVINKGLKDYAVEMGGDINKISVIPAGVDLERFNPQAAGSAIREKYGMKEVAESISITIKKKIHTIYLL